MTSLKLVLKGGGVERWKGWERCRMGEKEVKGVRNETGRLPPPTPPV